MNRGNFAQGDGSLKLHIQDLKSLSDSQALTSPTIFEPQTSTERGDDGGADSCPTTGPEVQAPEKKLTLFALRLAVLEKSATGLGTLGFIWATVVLLGGFAITLEKTDFWFITIILLVEGTRLFSRSHELEWQHQSTWSLAAAGKSSFRLLRSSSRLLARVLKAVFRPMSVIGSKSRHEGGELKEEAARRGRLGELNIKRQRSRRWNSLDVPFLPLAPWVFLQIVAS